MNTKDFINLVKEENGFDFAPQLSLLGGYLTMVFVFTFFVGATMTINFMIGGFAVTIYSQFKPTVAKGFILWWAHFKPSFHITLIILELATLAIFGKYVVWLTEKNK